VLCHPWSVTGEDPPIAKMRAATLRDAGVIRELIALCTAVSSVVERVLECSPDEASWVELMGS
jgi:putative component of membrane protein insertase Oxa1/YidC/SpoIIIJ protein YidD